MIEVGKIYATDKGRKFKIIGKKDISPTGFFYVGECQKLGLVAYFNQEGHHAHQSDLWLNVDTSKFIGIRKDNTLGSTKFLKREEIDTDEDFIGYLEIKEDNIYSLSFIGRGTV